MKFYVPINEAEVGESQTVHVIDTGSNCARTNRRYLREYFLKMGVPVQHVKRVMKQMGFTNDRLGVKRNVQTTESPTLTH